MRGSTPDVAIAGAGIIGASIAWRLAERGVRVTLFDAGVLGGEASTAGAGMLAPGGEYPEESPWAHLAVESRREYPAFVDQLRAETGVSIDFRPCGAIEFARTGEEWDALTRRAALQKKLGIRSERTADGAVFYPDEALVDPQDVMSALREACRRRGVAIREHTPVRAIRPRASSVELVAGNETIESRSAVLAAGAWAGAIPVEGVEIPASFPVKGHLVGFDVPAGTLGPILRHGHTYLMQRSSGFTVAGTSSEAGNFDRCVDQATALDIVFRARDLAPGLPLGRPVRSWVGFRPGVEAEGPQVRRIEGSNVWLAYGHYRNGILLAPVTARMVAGAIATDLV